MANNLTASAPKEWVSQVQDFLVNDLVATKVARLSFPGVTLDYGREIEMPYLTPGRPQTYVPGTDLAIDDTTSTGDTLTINTRIASTFYSDVTEYKQVMPKFNDALAQNCAYSLSNRIDQTLIQTGINGANSVNLVTGGTLSSASMLPIATEAYSKLGRNGKLRPGRDRAFMFVAPEQHALLVQNATAVGFNAADGVMNDTWQGNSYAGKWYQFDVFVTNNLPYTVVYTAANQPNDGDTVVVQGVTFTFKTVLGATAGNVLIGAANTDSIDNLVAAINGAAGAGSTYVEISVENRRNFQNNQVAAGTRSGNTTTITSFGIIDGSTPVNGGANAGFGAETSKMLFGAYGSLAGALQISPTLYIANEPKQIRQNYINYALFGTKVFFREAYRLGQITFNA